MEMQMGMSYVIAVVITGLVVVFLGLVLLIAFISIIGAIFKRMEQNKKAQANTDIPASNVPVSKPAPKIQPQIISKPVPADNNDDDEIIAVISAAVAMMSVSEGKNYRVRSVRAVSSNSGNAWAQTALSEATRPF